MGKVLFVATVVRQHIMVFHIPYLKMFKEQGWETAVAARNDYMNPEECEIPYCDTYFDLPFERSPLKMNNLRTLQKLTKIIEEGGYDIIHCHTPMGSVLARLAARKARKKGTRVIYTAHGFHFYKGAPLVNWLFYYPVEWLCAFLTDVLITINQEDYERAKKHLHAKQVEYVPGVGIDLEKFGNVETNRVEKRKELGVPDGAIWVLTVGELIQRKNHENLIRAVAELENVCLTIAGRGELEEYLENLIRELKLTDRVKLLGYRTDISELCEAADIFAFPSFQEGLPVALMEAMASGKPCVCSRVRGNIELMDENGGELFEPNDVQEIKNSLMKIAKRNPEELGKYNRKKIRRFDILTVMQEIEKIYDTCSHFDLSGVTGR